MPPRLAALRQTSRLLRLKQFPRWARRPYSTSPPPNPSPLPNPSVRFPLIAGGLALTAGITFYALSRSSNAEVQSSKASSGNENRELKNSPARKPTEQPGKVETLTNKPGGTSQNVKNEQVIAAKKAESGASEEDLQTGKMKGDHNESGQRRGERIQIGKSAEGEMDETKKEGSEEQEEDENGNGRGPVGIEYSSLIRF